MAANAVSGPPGGGFHGGPPTPYPPQNMPFGPGPGPSGPPFHTTPMPMQKNNTGRNVGLGIGALVVVGGIVAAIALSGGGGSDTKNANTTGGNTIPVASSGSHSSAPPTGASSSGDVPTTTQGSSTATGSDTPTTASTSIDPATWDTASTDKTEFTPDSLLPMSFTDDKGVVYNATNRWTDTCVNSYESTQLKALLNQYGCKNQAIGTYVDNSGRIMVDIAVLPLADAQTAKNAFHDMQSKNAFIFKDWGIWCPKTGPGADICTSDKDTTNAEQYGYIQPDHRYLVHAVSVYVNLSEDHSALTWLTPAATDAAKQGGPQVAVQ